MASSVIMNGQSSSSSSSSMYQTAEDEGEDRESLEIEAKIPDLNPQGEGLEHEVSRLILHNVEKNEKLMSLKRRIEQVNEDENQLNREIDELERRVLTLMLENGFKDEKLDKYGAKKERIESEDLKEKKLKQKFVDLMLEIGESTDKFRDLRIGFEKSGKHEKDGVSKGLGSDIGRKQVNVRELVSNKTDLLEKLGKMGNVVDVVDWSFRNAHNEIKELNESDDGEEEEEIGESGARELCKEIELLQVMLERGAFGLLDLKMMMEEVEALKGPEKMVSEMEMKMGELESGLCELKNAIVELKGKKSKELMGWVEKEEEKESESDAQEGLNARKHNWGSIVASLGAVVVAAAVTAMVFMGRKRVKVAAKKGKKSKTGWSLF